MTNNNEPCEGCGAFNEECIYDCAIRTERAVDALKLEQPDMPVEDLYRLDAHDWLEQHVTFEEQAEMQASIEAVEHRLAELASFLGLPPAEPTHCDCYPRCGSSGDCTRE